MVQTDSTQLSTECTGWQRILRSYRDEFHDCEKALLDMVKQPLTKEHFAQVEHFQNQFDIQLKNIHDLKLAIKSHQKVMQLNAAEDHIITHHDRMLTEFLTLENTLQQLREEFRDFINQNSC